MKTLTLAALLALGTAFAAPASMAASNVSVYIGSAPPAPLVERIPAPRAGYVWAPGHWDWNGRRHAWASGYWVAARPGYAYQAPVWYQDNRGWMLRPAAWTPYGPDRDRDGVPDRFERGPRHDGPYYNGPREHDGRPHGGRRDEDHDGVPNRFDRDRDGDGVPNRYDGRPDNPYRR
jgi:hypothetical protein